MNSHDTTPREHSCCATHAPKPTGDLRDPVCDMAVTEQSPHHYGYANQTHYFCSVHGQPKFTAAPHMYLHEQKVVQKIRGTIFTCPMHPEIRQSHPGTCPECEIVLELELPVPSEEENPELVDFSKRFWWALPLTLIVAFISMVAHQLYLMNPATQSWIYVCNAGGVVSWFAVFCAQYAVA